MSDLAKKCADRLRDVGTGDTSTTDRALAAFIEAAAAVLDECGQVGSPALGTVEKYDAALRELAQSMEVE